MAERHPVLYPAPTPLCGIVSDDVRDPEFEAAGATGFIRRRPGRVIRWLVGSNKTAARARGQPRQDRRQERMAVIRDARSQRSLVGFITSVDVVKKCLGPESTIAD